MGDRADRAACLELFGPPMERCCGGRIIVKGYVCVHCGSFDPPRSCDAPKGRPKVKPIRLPDRTTNAV